jgi:hypothetical protein
MLIDEQDYLKHYGTPRKSGRYPWGSGGPENQRNMSFLDYVADLRKEGMSDTEIARGLGMTTTEFRDSRTIARNEAKQAEIAQAQRLKEAGLSNIAIGTEMGKNESSVRALLSQGQKEDSDILTSTANMLKSQVEEKKYLDVGKGAELAPNVGVARTKMNAAIAKLQDEGYTIHYLKVDQLGTNQQTTFKILAAPGTTFSEVSKNRDEIKQITDFSEDGGRTYMGLKPPLSVDSKRVGINYADDGGAKADGVIYVRPGVSDVSLGGSRYAQVRVAVDGTHYLKGMAMYKDDLPPGVDLVFNTNKSDTGNKLDAMKNMKTDDPTNPFGASLRRQIIEVDKDGNERVTSAMNIVSEEGNWDSWSRSLSSQALSKQSPVLAKTQLNMTYQKKQDEFDEIVKLTNPAVRKKLLDSFANSTDASAVHLEAAAIPRSSWHVILPFNSIKDTEIYAPNFRNGEVVALIRYPHGGKFEIPELRVNNNQPEAKAVLGRAKDAVGINSKVAARLSGADFDGDAVLVIPNDRGAIKTAPALLGLKDFDPQKMYPSPDGAPFKGNKQHLMGDISNLITDMTIHGATNTELARAVRHSMVVIDSEKHNLNYKQSAIENNIVGLKKKYQGGATKGASTLISRAEARKDVLARKDRTVAKGGPIDKATGKRMYEETGDSYVNAKGKVIFRTERSKKLAETDDAFTLSSGTTIEKVYAEHSNKLKALANQSRLEMINTKPIPYSPSAKAAYSKEVASLDSKLKIAQQNSPLERQAQLIGNTILSTKKDANPNMDSAEIKKIKAQALTEARLRTGAKKQQIVLTDSEWDAIQAGAISNNKLTQILDNSDLTRIKELATPRSLSVMTSADQQRAQAMLASGYTQAQVADAVGVSLTTLKTSLKED